MLALLARFSRRTASSLPAHRDAIALETVSGTLGAQQHLQRRRSYQSTSTPGLRRRAFSKTARARVTAPAFSSSRAASSHRGADVGQCFSCGPRGVHRFALPAA